MSMQRLVKRFKQAIYAPNIVINRGQNLLRLGSDYGGWIFEDSSDLHEATIISCGLGEDASFDVEFAARYGATVIIVDPTPRAIAHFNEIHEAIGQEKTLPYVSGGYQPISAYPLDKIDTSSLALEPSALWIEEGTLKFFAPPHAGVSHSIINFQNEYAKDTAHIEVEAITPRALITKYGLTSVPLMKLDIEGAEIEIISYLMKHSIAPRQLLIEFDEVAVPSAKSRNKIENADGLLRQAGYRCRSKRGTSNFLYIKD